MATRTQIAIQTGPEQWTHFYVHYDGYPSYMLPALARWKPEDILAAREIRQVKPNELDCFDPPRPPRIHASPTLEFCYLYVWRNEAWAELKEQPYTPPISAAPCTTGLPSAVPDQ